MNAANSTLLGGGGVDGAIHRAAGPQLLEACKKLNGCPTGQAKLTPGYNLPAKIVIHTVGPVWRGGGHNEAGLLASAYKSSLDIAYEHRFKSIAFPSISTGVYEFPVRQAAHIAVNTIITFLKSHPWPVDVTMMTFSQDDYRVYQDALKTQKKQDV